MDLIRTLNSVGKSTFVKYYYNFKNKSREECISSFSENYTDVFGKMELVQMDPKSLAP